MALGIIALAGWAVAAGLVWTLSSERTERREEVARLEQSHGTLKEIEGRVASAKTELEKLGKTRTDAQAALEAAQKQQAEIKSGMQELTQNRDKIAEEVSRVERSLADLTKQSAERTRDLATAQQELADRRAALEKATRERQAAEQQIQAAQQQLEKLRADIGAEQQNIKPAAQ
jgi:chromosome segregation ATPase